MIDAVVEHPLPSGVVTFVLSDIVGSTRLWERAPAAMEPALARHEAIVTGVMVRHGGVVLRSRGEGDSMFTVFSRATDAVAAAYAAQVGLLAEAWPSGAHVVVRFAVHTGESVERDGDFFGPTVNRAARLRAVANGGEVLLSESTARLVADRLPAGVRLVEFGEVELRDIRQHERVYALTGPGLPEPRVTGRPHQDPEGPELASRGVTRREAEVLSALGEHLTNAQIASRLYVSERTVESHVSSLLRKFGATNRQELVRAAATEQGSAPRARSRLPAALAVAIESRPFTGSRRELDLIRSLWRRISAGRSLMAVVTGDEGAGKSRLVAELAAEVDGEGGVVLLGMCAKEAPNPYQPFVHAIREDLERLSDDEVRHRLAGEARALGSLMPLGLDEASSDTRERPPEPPEIVDAVVGYIARASRTSNVLLVIEDLHLADNAVWDVLRGHSALIGGLPILVVATARSSPPDRADEFAALLADLAAQPSVLRVDISDGDGSSAMRWRSQTFPRAVTSLVDRQDELSRLSSLMARHNLVTLIGAGGTGKTRLATHYAETLTDLRGDQSWYAEFTAVKGKDDVVETLMGAFGVRSAPDSDLPERVIRHVASREGLLVLDNCEHVRAPVAAICDRVLRSAPTVRILATSREPLGVTGEVLFPVPPLAVPDVDAPEDIAAAHAVQLFVERASRYSPAFTLGGHNSTAVAELCRCLDGLPLAIELAAARVPTMTPDEIVSRLDHHFQVLGRRSDRADHHRTLRATLDWSYDLLEPDEQMLLARLAVFAPGFTLAAVEAVGQETSHERYVLDVLSGLVSKSMVVAETKDGATRLRMLETVRAFGLEKAALAGVDEETRRRHVDYYTQLADALAGPGVVADVDVRSQELAAEAANIRSALDHAVDAGDAASTFDLTANIVDLWCLWGWGGAILSALETVLRRDDAGTSGRPDALANAAWSAWSQGRHSKAVAWCDESERCSASAGDVPPARVHFIRGLSRLLDHGDIDAGVTLCERGLEQLQQAGDQRRYAHDLASYATYLAVAGDAVRVPILAARAVALAREMRDHHSLGIALLAMAYASIDVDPQGARAKFDETAGIGDRWCAASALWGLGWLADRAGDDVEAARRYREALELWSETGDWRGIYFSVQGIAILATRLGRLESAARLFAGADSLASDVGAGSIQAWNAWRGKHLDILRDALSPGEPSTARAASEGLDPQVVIREALEEARRAERAEDGPT
jgi:predicted ATPase/class 3 adenylate cyclase/DNA-binding CsgD family transcriptional regulator